MSKRSAAWVVLAAGTVAIVAAAVLVWRETAGGLPPRTAPQVAFPVESPFQGSWQVVEAFPGMAFERPLGIVQESRPPHRFFVLQQGGTILALTPGAAAPPVVVLDLTSRVYDRSESGLLGLALHPDFGDPASANGRYAYVFYVTPVGSVLHDRVSRFTIDLASARADEASELVLIDQTDEDFDHNSGNLIFGSDGHLYVGVGDEGGIGDSFGNGQKIDKDLFSGILRIDVDCRGGSKPIGRQPQTGRTQGYCIPADNPFVGVRDALEEFWSIGLRNPYRFTFDGEDLWGGDVGQDSIEVVFVARRGSNHGWSYREGASPFLASPLKGVPPSPLHGTLTSPAYSYSHTNENGCIIGGYVYRGEQLPELQGSYIFGDFNSGRIFALTTGAVPKVSTLLRLPPDRRITGFGLDMNRELLLGVSGQRSGILRLTRRPVDPAQTAQ
jgi:glucose/arabinose dehydrogenase